MKLKDLGAHVNVSVSVAELEAFANSWPCSGMRGASRGITFQFEKSCGDLVDIWGQQKRFDDRAVSALADVKLPAIVSSNMVLQRGVKARIWGTADRMRPAYTWPV